VVCGAVLQLTRSARSDADGLVWPEWLARRNVQGNVTDYRLARYGLTSALLEDGYFPCKPASCLRSVG
jgi:hypothetical protein